MRGRLTDEVKQKSLELLEVQITQEELRLMPYVHYVMMNSREIDPLKISNEETITLSIWEQRGWIILNLPSLRITKTFWNALGEILWLTYVNYEE